MKQVINLLATSCRGTFWGTGAPDKDGALTFLVFEINAIPLEKLIFIILVSCEKRLKTKKNNFFPFLGPRKKKMALFLENSPTHVKTVFNNLILCFSSAYAFVHIQG